jgi:hypothetical protein
MTSPSVSNPEAWVPSAKETAWALLDRINFYLASTLGPDFELGHGYVYPVSQAVDEDAGYRALARVWDQRIYPQLKERFNSRPEELDKLLNLTNVAADGSVLISIRKQPIGAKLPMVSRVLISVLPLEPATATQLDAVRKTLRLLAGL